MNSEIEKYNLQQTPNDLAICKILAEIINQELPEVKRKIWHGHRVWFIEGNPIVGYSKQKKGLRLMFWSGADFEEDKLNVKGKKFKDASIFYQEVTEIDTPTLQRWLQKAKNIQWDYKNIVKRRGHLKRLK